MAKKTKSETRVGAVGVDTTRVAGGTVGGETNSLALRPEAGTSQRRDKRIYPRRAVGGMGAARLQLAAPVVANWHEGHRLALVRPGQRQRGGAGLGANPVL
eukprot:3146853-Pyramimonas_sp.AAC.1